MKMAMYDAGARGARMGVVVDDLLVDANDAFSAYLDATGDDCVSQALRDALAPADTVLYLQGGARCREAVEAAMAWFTQRRASGAAVQTRWGADVASPRAAVRLLPPVTNPPKILCVGLNYRDHAEEQNAKLPKNPILFAKYTKSLVGAGAPVVHPTITEALDYEAEVAIVIGRGGKDIPLEQALEHIAGYTCFNDITSRDIQLADRQWLRGKMGDTHAPMGPYLVTSDEIDDFGSMTIKLWVNDQLLQDSTLDQLIFGCAELVSFISESVTLEPGDVIATGTPGGVGFVRTPPVYLVPGDIVRMEVDGLGVLENPVVRPDEGG